MAKTETDKQAVTIFRKDLNAMTPQFGMVLSGTGITPEEFARVVTTAVMNNPKLFQCELRSILSAAMKAAEDGLLPDGREGVIIPFNEKLEGGGRQTRAVWLPMVWGLIKKVRQSGEIRDIEVEAVFEGDEFFHEKGDNPHIVHVPADGGRTRQLTHVYSRAIFKAQPGETPHVSRKVMSFAEIEEIRKRFARSERGPWSDPMSYSEMAKKTVLRLHSKTLPMSKKLEQVFRRIDEVQGIEADKPDAKVAADEKRKLMHHTGQLLDQFAGTAAAETGDEEEELGATVTASPKDGSRHDAETGEIIENEASQNYMRAALTKVKEFTEVKALDKWANDEKGNREVLTPAARQELLGMIWDRKQFLEKAHGQSKA